MVVRHSSSETLRTASQPLVVTLDEVGRDDRELVGGKAASLGEIHRVGIRVPPGFVVTSCAYRQFVADNKLDGVIAGSLRGLDVDDAEMREEAASQIQESIETAPMPLRLAAVIGEAYERLGCGPVAVRSSATAEDLLTASFAGQQQTFLNVERIHAVVAAVRACWASLYEARAIFYRHTKGFGHVDVAMAVVVQRMIPADVSGVMFTADPTSGNRDVVLIEAVYGLGEPLVSGELSPDAYYVNKGTGAVLRRELSSQPWYLRRGPRSQTYATGSERCPVPEAWQQRPKLSEAGIGALADVGLRLERHYGHPQDVEWAMVAGELHIVQSRPITTAGESQDQATAPAVTLQPWITGAPASPGVAAGPVRRIVSAREAHQVKSGDVLVTEMTTPDFVPTMKRASAIVTDRGGRTCHAAIVSREMGIPCVVGTRNATRTLTPGETVTVDGSAGKVYAGDVMRELGPARTVATVGRNLQTRTKLYVNLADPDMAERVGALDTDGVGLLRAEFIMSHIGEHPRAMLDSGRGAEFTGRLAEGVATFASRFHPRPVVYRFSDFKTNEYRNLRGGEAYEGHEENPMLGYRGCARYLAEPEVFALEAMAINRVREQWPNVWVMVPFVRTVDELTKFKQLLAEWGLLSGPDLKVWMMLEVPANVILLNEFLSVGVDGVSIGSNDLTQLTLGVDRDNERLAAKFDERNPAVLRALERVIAGCAARGVTVSICGQAPSVFPELTRMLVDWGITSVSVSPDMLDETRRIIHTAENADRPQALHPSL